MKSTKEILLENKPVSINYQITPSHLLLDLSGKEVSIELLSNKNNNLKLKINEKIVDVSFKTNPITGETHFTSDDVESFLALRKRGASSHQASSGNLTAPMPGKVFKVMVNTGDHVKAGQTLMILEAMKMEHPVKAPYDGIVSKIFYRPDDQLDKGVQLIELTKDDGVGDV
jgi:3-methylcrotonyl-CoA carboxylase alpha subunit